MKKIIFALAVLMTVSFASCVQEKAFNDTKLGENAIAFVMQNSSTRAADMNSHVTKGITLKMGTTPYGEPIELEETIEELNPGPATKGAPVYTKNVGLVYSTMGVYSPTTSFGNNIYECIDERLTYAHDKFDPSENPDLGWRYHHIYGSSPWPNKTDPVDFYMRMPAQGTGASVLTPSDYDTANKTLSFTLQSPEKAANQQDLLFGFTSINKQTHDNYLPNGAPVTMYHALSAVKFANGHENNNATKTIITKVEFTGLVDNGTLIVNPRTGTTTVNPTEGVAPVTSGYKFYQDYSDPTYTASAGANNSDGTVDFTDPATNPDLYGTSWTNGTQSEDMKKAAADHNLNNADGELTFWFIPQTISNDVKLTVTFQIKTPDTPNGIDLKPITINFGELVNAKGAVEWKAGQLRTYTLKPYEVDVEIEDTMTETIKSNVHIANTGNVDEYVRVLIMGNWYGWRTQKSKDDGDEPSILVGYKYKTPEAAAEAGESYDTMVDPWFRGGYDNDGDGTFVDPYGHFDDSFLLADLKAAGRDGQRDDWADASGGFYYTMKIGPGTRYQNTDSATKNLFNSYTVTKVPHIYLPFGDYREEAVGVHLVMEIVVQAIEVPKNEDGTDKWWLQAWYEATGIEKLKPTDNRNKAYYELYQAGAYNPEGAPSGD